MAGVSGRAEGTVHAWQHVLDGTAGTVQSEAGVVRVLSEAGSDLRIQLKIHLLLTCMMEGRPGKEGRSSNVRYPKTYI